MSDLNIKDFLIHGAFLQIGEDRFKVLIGPFKKQDLNLTDNLGPVTLLYKPDFWDFFTDSTKSSQKVVYAAAKAFTFHREEFIRFLSSAQSQKAEIKWNKVSELQFKEQFDWSKRIFSEQKLTKTVPIVKQDAQFVFKVENLLWCIQTLIQKKTFGWSYGFFQNNVGMIGHTPEILTQWSSTDQRLHTVALAGTYPKNEGQNSKIKTELFKKILEDKKIQNEHQIVIDDIINKINLKPEFTQGLTEVLELKYLLHLMTQFQVKVPTLKQAFEVIDVLHPTAAMGIYPFDLSMMKKFSEFLIQKERASFAAPFAIIEQHSIFCVVAIRNMLFSNDRVQLFSGCGITNESDYELELAELQSKRESVKKMLGLSSEG